MAQDSLSAAGRPAIYSKNATFCASTEGARSQVGAVVGAAVVGARIGACTAAGAPVRPPVPEVAAASLAWQ